MNLVEGSEKAKEEVREREEKWGKGKLWPGLADCNLQRKQAKFGAKMPILNVGG